MSLKRRADALAQSFIQPDASKRRFMARSTKRSAPFRERSETLILMISRDFWALECTGSDSKGHIKDLTLKTIRNRACSSLAFRLDGVFFLSLGVDIAACFPLSLKLLPPSPYGLFLAFEDSFHCFSD